MTKDLLIWTVGHSTKSAEEFGRLLQSQEIETLVDVRSFPGSRRYPQFNKESLSEFLSELGIKYVHAPALGGRRRSRPDSRNTSWQNASFRAYADHMESEEFAEGIAELLTLAAEGNTAVMCAEALWWRCHRSLIADYLKSNGIEVLHILGENKVEPHPYTSAARIVNGELSYEGLFKE